MGADQSADAQATHGTSSEAKAAAVAHLREQIEDLEAERDRIVATHAGDFLGNLEAKRKRLQELEQDAAAGIDVRPVGEVFGPDFMTKAPPPRQALLRVGGKPFVVQGKVGLLLAPGGTGKSWAFTQLAVAVATGGRWFGTYEATKGRVLLALGEEDADEVKRRLYDVGQGLGLTEYERAEVGRNLIAWGMAGRSVALLSKNAAGELGPSQWFGEVRAALEVAGPWRCILLDPWSRWGGPDVEKDNHAATRAVELLEELAKLPGSPTIIVAHHTRKGSKEDTTSGADADASRGASALVDGARWVANLVRQKGDSASNRPLVFGVTKRNHTAASEPIELLHDESGVLRPMTTAEKAERNAFLAEFAAKSAEAKRRAAESKRTKRPTGPTDAERPKPTETTNKWGA